MLRNSETWGGLFWLAIGAFVTWEGYKLGLGKLIEPGSGFAIYWIGLLMVFLSGIVLIQTALSGVGADISSLWADTRWGRIIAVVLMLLVLGYFFERVGYIPLVFGLLLLCMFFIDPVRWWIAIPVAVIAAFGSWALLTETLRIQLPAGILEGAIDDRLRVIARQVLGAIGAFFGAIRSFLIAILR